MKKTSNILHPVVLLILDGWGLSPSWGGNAIAMSNPPFINSLWKKYPHLILQAFRKLAGPSGKVASSEIGHSSIGCGRLVYQDLSKINKAIQNSDFYKNQALTSVCDFVKKNHSSLHLTGLLSDGSIHSHIDHLFALLSLAKKQKVYKVYLHCILDGIDSPKTSALIYLSRLQAKLNQVGIGKISTISGRSFAMDRDGNWDRIKRAYLAMTKGKGNMADSPLAAVSKSYKKGFTDDEIPPIVLTTESKKQTSFSQFIKNNDGVIFFNFRPDRARQLTRAFVDKSFRPLWCIKKPKVFFVTLTQYQKGLPVSIAFAAEPIKNSLAEVLSAQNLKQLHIAESEKYAHITYFLNGWREEPYKGEDRIIISSPKVDSYDKTPEMKVDEIGSCIIAKMKKYHFVVANIANVDLVGHTGKIEAVSRAIDATDNAIKKITEAVLNENGTLIITADHGNAEQMVHLQSEGDKETLHTLNPVPFLLVEKNLERTPQKFASELSSKNILKDIMESEYTLADIAPTILEILKIKKPKEMTGSSLLNKLC